jgi:hypothetical protein
VVVQAVTTPFVLAGLGVLDWIPGGLFWLAFGVLFALCAATANAWVLLVEVVRDERYRPVEAEGHPGAAQQTRSQEDPNPQGDDDAQ